MNPKFIFATGASLFLFAASGYSQWAVIDVAHIAQDEVNQTLNYVDYVGTQVNTYEQQLNQVEQLKRLGDPSTLTNLAGLNKLGTSVQTLGAPMQGTPQITGGVSSLTSGSVLQLNGATPTQIFSSLQGTYKPINATGVTSSGTTFNRSPDQYVYKGAVANASNNYASRMADIGTQQTKLTSQINDTLQSLNGAQTDAEVQKYSALLAAQNAQLANLNQQAAQVAAQATQQQTTALAQDQATKQAQAEQNEAEAADGEKKAATYFTFPTSNESLQKPTN